jgi:hypothetical protein
MNVRCGIERRAGRRRHSRDLARKRSAEVHRTSPLVDSTAGGGRGTDKPRDPAVGLRGSAPSRRRPVLLGAGQARPETTVVPRGRRPGVSSSESPRWSASRGRPVDARPGPAQPSALSESSHHRVLNRHRRALASNRAKVAAGQGDPDPQRHHPVYRQVAHLRAPDGHSGCVPQAPGEGRCPPESRAKLGLLLGERCTGP